MDGRTDGRTDGYIDRERLACRPGSESGRDAPVRLRALRPDAATEARSCVRERGREGGRERERERGREGGGRREDVGGREREWGLSLERESVAHLLGESEHLCTSPFVGAHVRTGAVAF
jgi:hypothetical protein